MNKEQTKKLISYELIVKESQNDPVSLALVPKFSKGITRLAEINTEIGAIGIQQEKDLRGITIDKDKKLSSMIDRIIEIGGAVHSHAHDVDNSTLMTRVAYKSTALRRMSKPEIVTVAGVILQEALLLPAEILLEEGISPEDLSILENMIGDFSEVKSAPKEAIIDRSESTEKLRALFKEANSIVKNSLDKLAPQYKRKAPEFYRRYRISRGVGTSSKNTVPTPEPVTEPEPVR